MRKLTPSGEVVLQLEEDQRGGAGGREYPEMKPGLNKEIKAVALLCGSKCRRAFCFSWLATAVMLHGSG